MTNIFECWKQIWYIEFSSFAISVKYSDVYIDFLKDMIGLSLKRYNKVSKDVGAYEVYKSISQSLQIQIFKYLIIKSFIFSLKLQFWWIYYK